MFGYIACINLKIYVLWTTKIIFNRKYRQNYKNTSPTFINVYINKCTLKAILYVDFEKKSIVRIWKIRS